MKKISLVALAVLIASASVASAQSFDLNTLPLSNFPAVTDDVSTGSIGAPLHKRIVVRDGVKMTQIYQLDADGKIVVVSEEKN